MAENMIKGKKHGKTLDEIGKRWHEFNLKSEKNIYCYVCCKRVKKKALRDLNEELKFETYQQWKQYVCNKYQNYNIDELIEFSRYLNQMIRNLKPSHEYSSIVASALTSVIFTVTFNWVFNTYKDFSNLPLWRASGVMMLLVIFLFIPILHFINDITNPLFDKHFERIF